MTHEVPTCCPTHSDVEHAKPNPDLFLAAAGGLGVDIRQSFVGGDSIWDLLPHSVPVRSGIGVLSGGFGRSELERANTYRVFDDASDLLTRLDELGVRGRSADLIESICLSAYPLLGRVSSFAVLVRRSRGQRNVECIRVGRPRQAPIPRTPFAGGEVTIRVTDGDDDTEHPILVRQYRDAIGDVRVTRRSSSKMPRVNELLDTYTYADRPLIESWVEPDGRIVDNAIIEMRVGALSFARMGVAGVRFNPRVPPDPDLFVDSDETGSLGVEITLDKDPDESSFQTEMQAYTAFLNSVAGDALPVHCDLGFKTVPRPRDADRMARAIIAAVRENADVLGAHQFEGELASLFSQYLLSKRTDGPPFSGGGVVNDRGMSDHYASAMRRIAEKRDLKDYRTRGRQTWLLVGMSIPGVFAPDTNRQFYDEELDLGQFDRIVLCHAFDYVVFERRLVTP